MSVRAKQFLVERLQQIPQGWRASLQKAEEHNDVEKAHIEKLKLEVVDDIQRTVEEIWGKE